MNKLVFATAIFISLVAANATSITLNDFSDNATVIDFEGLAATAVVSNQFASSGILFNNVDVFSESENAPFGFNGSRNDIATSGSNYISKRSVTTVFTFTTPVTRVGAFIIDPSELSTPTRFTAFFADGGSFTIDVPRSAATSDPAPFVGIENLGGITSAQITTSNGDPIGIDDVIFETSAAVPEPTTILLLLFGLCSIVIRKRLA